MHMYDISILFAAMVFENCTDDQRSGNILTSPEFTLLSDQALTFTMSAVNSNLHSAMNVYKTSILDTLSTLLGFYSAISDSGSAISVGNNSAWNSSANHSSSSAYAVNINHSLCLPAGTYRLAFFASQVENVTKSTVLLTEVLLTNTPCTYNSLAGKLTQRYSNLVDVRLSVFFVILYCLTLGKFSPRSNGAKLE